MALDLIKWRICLLLTLRNTLQSEERGSIRLYVSDIALNHTGAIAILDRAMLLSTPNITPQTLHLATHTGVALNSDSCCKEKVSLHSYPSLAPEFSNTCKFILERFLRTYLPTLFTAESPMHVLPLSSDPRFLH